MSDPRDFYGRFSQSEQHVSNVYELSKSHGWHVIRIDQFDRKFISILDTLFRWIPDLLLLKPGIGVLIECKSGDSSKTGNHAIEIKSLDAAEYFSFAGLPVFLVFDDFHCAPTSIVRASSKPGPYRGKGSGTPFVLLPRTEGAPFDAVFGNTPEAIEIIMRFWNAAQQSMYGYNK